MDKQEITQSFVLNGKKYSFTSAKVIEVMRNQTPRRIEKYQVSVDGRQFPPKQVLERLTGVEPINFTTMDAQRILNRLGYRSEVSTRDGRTESAEVRNQSEQYLEYYLRMNGYPEFEYQPVHSTTTRRPDYRLSVGNERIILEVKEFTVSNEDFLGFAGTGNVRGGAFDPYGPIRQKIDDAREQFKGLKDSVCCLVLFNQNKPLVDLNWQMIYGAMLGDLAWHIPFNPATEEFDDSQTTNGFSRNRKCGPNKNTTLSAVIALEPLMLGERRFRCHLTKLINELGRENLSWDERFDIERKEREIARGTDRDPENIQWRLVVNENPWARNKLSRDIFCGRFDERYGDPGGTGTIRRLYAGDPIEELESLEHTYPRFRRSFRELPQKQSS